jgi:thiamine-phosphate pyrophosphorylase
MIEKTQYISQGNSITDHLQGIDKVLDAGVKWIQLRIKNNEELLVLKAAQQVKMKCENYKAKFIVNDSPWIAKEVDADGVHLGLNDMPIFKAREIVGNEMIIGGTANTFEDIFLRNQEKVDYIGLGPYRFTRTKVRLSPILGLEGYRSILSKMKSEGIFIPVIAIGGIVEDDITSLIFSGAHGVALSGNLYKAKDANKLVERINKITERGT